MARAVDAITLSVRGGRGCSSPGGQPAAARGTRKPLAGSRPKRLATAEPTWLVGFSDLTALEWLIVLGTALVTTGAVLPTWTRTESVADAFDPSVTRSVAA